jgi:phosphotransferase system  glucose/maltose/N-acetylglucosamine-specific IIC component
MRSVLVPQLAPDKVKKHRFSDYATRFAFGAGIALVAGIIGMIFGPKLGGVFLGFPAILPASLTLVQKKEGKDEASIDSIGAMLGAAAMIVFAVFVSLAANSVGGATSVLVALVVWLVVAVALYFLVALTFRREPHPR